MEHNQRQRYVSSSSPGGGTPAKLSTMAGLHKLRVAEYTRVHKEKKKIPDRTWTNFGALSGIRDVITSPEKILAMIG